MPLIVFCGQPLSGKTTNCNTLAQKFAQRGIPVTVISPETTLSLNKNDAYCDSVHHKNTRSGLRSAVERAISDSGSVVLLDALNNIKGCRYEIWCLARSAATKYCLVHIDAGEDICRIRNQEQALPYRLEILEDLLCSFERPDSRNRWEAPLYTISTDRETNDDSEETLDQIIKLICGQPQTKSTNPDATLRPTDATSNPTLAETNLQHDIDKATKEIVTRLTELQSQVGAEAIGTASFGSELPSVHFKRPVSVTEVRRLKRGFLKLVTQNYQSRVPSAEAAKRLFLEYLEQNLDN